jgi:hypothetical protein
VCDPARRPRAEDVVALLDGRAASEMTQVGALPPPPREEETVRLLAPTLMVAPPPAPARPAAAPASQPEPVVIPAASEKVARRQYPGVRSGGAVAAILLGSAALGVAGAAADASDVVGVDRTGLILPTDIGQDDAIAALVILGAAAVLTLSLVVLAIWAARQSSRARMSFVRGLLGLIAIVVAGVAAGALVWTANAGSTAGISDLISSAGF